MSFIFSSRKKEPDANEFITVVYPEKLDKETQTTSFEEFVYCLIEDNVCIEVYTSEESIKSAIEKRSNSYPNLFYQMSNGNAIVAYDKNHQLIHKLYMRKVPIYNT